jgi:hypothetical protein
LRYSFALLQVVFIEFGELHSLEVVLLKAVIGLLVDDSEILLILFILVVQLIEENYLIQVLFHLADNVGNKRGHQFLLFKLCPVQVREEEMLLYLPYAPETYSFTWISLEQAIY